MTQATVKYIVNGFTVTGMAPSTTGEMSPVQSHYAATLPEAMYWVGQILEPPPGTQQLKSARLAPELNLASDDPLANQEALITPLTTGGYLVRQQVNFAIPSRAAAYEAQCYNLDEVANVLTQVFTAPPPVVRSNPFAIGTSENRLS